MSRRGFDKKELDALRDRELRMRLLASVDELSELYSWWPSIDLHQAIWALTRLVQSLPVRDSDKEN
jgi:hypothetical protein